MKINRIELFAFSYTDKCNIKCAHCIAGSSPEKHKKLDLERLLLFVKQLKEFNIKSFEITGGEALVFFDEVIELLSVGKQAGVSSSVISNGSWGFSEENAERVVSKLTDAGLKDLFISSDEFHLEFVPAKSVFNIVDAVMKRKEPIKVFLRFCESKNYSFLDFLTENAGYFKNLKKKYPKKDLRVLTQFLAPLGRAFKKVPKENYVIKAKLAENPCNLVKRPFLNADGNIFCCCNGPKLNNPLTAPYFLGNFYSDSPAEFIKNYEESLFVFYLRTKSPVFIEKLARKHNLTKMNALRRLTGNYTGMCDFCVLNLGQYSKQDLDNLLLHEFSKDKAMQKLAVKESLKFQKNKN